MSFHRIVDYLVDTIVFESHSIEVSEFKLSISFKFLFLKYQLVIKTHLVTKTTKLKLYSPKILFFKTMSLKYVNLFTLTL